LCHLLLRGLPIKGIIPQGKVSKEEGFTDILLHCSDSFLSFDKVGYRSSGGSMASALISVPTSHFRVNFILKVLCLRDFHMRLVLSTRWRVRQHIKGFPFFYFF
jgi:hypothetical protein